MKPTPHDWPRCSPSLFYRDAAAAIDWLCTVFGFSTRLRIEGEGGHIEHSELSYGDGLIMVVQEKTAADGRAWLTAMRSPKSLGGAGTQCVMLFVDDADAHCAHARAHGAQIVDEPSTHDYGAQYWTDRSYGALDIEGHMWWFTQRLD